MLADLISQSLASRLENTAELRSGLPAMMAQVAIVGPGGVAAVLPPHMRVLRLSADLTRLLGPAPDDNCAFTMDALAVRLLAIAASI